MQHLEGSGTPVLYIGRARFLKVKHRQGESDYMSSAPKYPKKSTA